MGVPAVVKHFLNTLIDWAIINNFNYFVTASTGIASDLYVNGKTVHSFFKLELGLRDDICSKIEMTTDYAKNIKNAKFIIIDEASMLSKFIVNAIDEKLQELMNNDMCFGGKIIIFCGDFRQLPLVVPFGTYGDIFNFGIKQAKHWSELRTLNLTVNMRANNFVSFNKWLLDLSTNKYAINSHVVLPKQFITTLNPVDLFYSNANDFYTTKNDNTIILASTNQEVNEINTEVLAKLNIKKMIYIASNFIEQNLIEELHTDFNFVAKATPSGYPLHLLKLKINCIVIILKNIDQENGLINGTKGKVFLLNKYFIGIRIIGSKYNNEKRFIHKMNFNNSEPQATMNFTRYQLPVKLAYAMTIHKCQGQTYKKVCLYLSKNLFSHG